MGGEQGMEGSVVLQELESHGVGLDEGGTRFVCNGLLGNLHSKKWKRFFKTINVILGRLLHVQGNCWKSFVWCMDRIATTTIGLQLMFPGSHRR